MEASWWFWWMLMHNCRHRIILVPPILSSFAKEAPVCYVNIRYLVAYCLTCWYPLLHWSCGFCFAESVLATFLAVGLGFVPQCLINLIAVSDESEWSWYPVKLAHYHDLWRLSLGGAAGGGGEGVLGLFRTVAGQRKRITWMGCIW